MWSRKHGRAIASCATASTKVHSPRCISKEGLRELIHMPNEARPNLIDLSGKKGLIVGIANDQSIAYGCAKVMRRYGADLAVTYLNAKAEPHVRPISEALGCDIIMPCDVEQPGQMEAVFNAIAQRWGRLDFVVHAIAYAPKECLHLRVVECEKENFFRAIDVSCHSFVRMARLAEPLMNDGGCLI